MRSQVAGHLVLMFYQVLSCTIFAELLQYEAQGEKENLEFFKRVWFFVVSNENLGLISDSFFGGVTMKNRKIRKQCFNRFFDFS